MAEAKRLKADGITAPIPLTIPRGASSDTAPATQPVLAAAASSSSGAAAAAAANGSSAGAAAAAASGAVKAPVFASASSLAPGLVSVFYSVFDNDTGPKVSYQSPKGFWPSEAFDEVSDFIITCTELCHKLVTFTHRGYTVLGYPVSLSDKKYRRNALLFNVGFVFSSGTAATSAAFASSSSASAATPAAAAAAKVNGDAAVVGPMPATTAAASSPSSSTAAVVELYPFQAVLRKLACVLETVEIESEFLLQHTAGAAAGSVAGTPLPNLGSPPPLQLLLDHVLTELQRTGECDWVINASTRLQLKLYPRLSPATAVRAHDVPIVVGGLSLLERMRHDGGREWDLTLRQVLPFVDGVNYVARISALADVDIVLVKKCLRQLLYYGCIALIDIFQYSNVYVPTASLARLYTDAKLQADCVEYITLAAALPPNGAGGTATTVPAKTTPTQQLLKRVFFLYASLARGVRMSEFAARHALHEWRIDPRRFAVFGVLNGLVRRIHKYPVIARDLHILKKAAPGAGAAGAGADAAAAEQAAAAAAQQAAAAATVRRVGRPPGLDKMLDGRHTYDEICVALGLSNAELDSIIRLDDSAIAISK